MGLKYKFVELFSGKFPKPQQLYDQLKDLQSQIDKGSEPVPPVKEDVKLTKTGLKKAFGDPKEFKSLGIVRNAEGSYLVASDGKGYKIITLENI
jgi:hypothetical protein